MLSVIGFEIPMLGLVKVNDDVHDLTDAQLPSTKSLFAAIFLLLSFPNW
jgi:hypothetical protein